MEKETLLEELGRIEKFYGKDKFVMNQEIYELWYELISDYREDVFHESVNRYIQNNVYPPNLAGILQYYNEIVNLHDERMKKITSNCRRTASVWGEKLTNETFHAWMEYVKQFPLEEVTTKSQKLADKAYDYYYDCICKGEEIPPLKEYIGRWMQKDN